MASTHPSTENKTTIGVGILGAGNVGAALIGILTNGQDAIGARTGLSFEVRKVGVRDVTRDRGLPLAAQCFTADLEAVVNDPDVDVVVELLGGVEPAKALISSALIAGKPVITGNKALIAVAGPELTKLAADCGTVLLYEAAVGGGIPIMRPLRESLAGEPIQRVVGIVNGTTNYILTRMTEDGDDYADALADAQALGFAEADPTADVEAFDAAAKATIIASVAFGANVSAEEVHREGISSITADDIALASRLGFVIKLLAVVQRSDDGRVGVRAHPTLVPKDHPLASVRLSFNAVFVQGDSVGDLMFYGRGAGGKPTASAVVGDLIDAAKRKLAGPQLMVGVDVRRASWPLEEQSSAFSITLDVIDEPGVLAAVTGVFAANAMSILSMEQLGHGDEARLVFITHQVLERSMQSCVHDLEKLDAVQRIGNIIRVLEP